MVVSIKSTIRCAAPGWSFGDQLVATGKDKNLKQTRRIDTIRAQAATLFAQRGFNAVGVSELCEATGLGRGALYYHIKSKEDLLYDISTRYIRELISNSRDIAAAELDPVERIRKLSRCIMDVVYTHTAEMTVCFREIHAFSGERYREVLQLHMDYQQIWVDTLAMGASQGAFREIPKVTVKGIMGMFFYSFMWLKPVGNQNADGVADAFSDLIIRGLVKDISIIK